MTQCNLAKYLEKNALVLRIRVSFKKICLVFNLNLNIFKVTIKEVFDNFSIGNELLETKGKILRDLHALVANEKISDFKFVVEGKEFFVHKALLSGEKMQKNHKFMQIILQFYFLRIRTF